MNILQEILKAGGGQAVGELAKQFGMNQADTSKALSNLIPVIAGGIKKSASSKSGLESLISKANANPNLRDAIDLPEGLGASDAAGSGNDILGEIFGSKDVSRQVAGQAASSTGLDVGMLKKMLPLVAGLVMSSLNKQSQQSQGGLEGLLGALVGGTQAQKPSSGLGSLLGGLLGGRRQSRQQAQGLESLFDFDGDGDVTDDVLNLAKKLF